MTIICPACNQVLGHGSELEADVLAREHADNCQATDEEHATAMTRLQFNLLTKTLNL